MKKRYSIDALSSILLFALYVLLLLLMLMSAANVYSRAVQGAEENYHLRTAMSYVRVKIRHHDNGKDVFPGEIQGVDALCMTDDIDGATYTTYIYLYEGALRELFTAEASGVSLSMGTSIADLDAFAIEETPEHFYRISMVDADGNEGSLLIHPDAPV